MWLLIRAMPAVLLVTLALPARSETPGPAATAGPGRITCATAKACVLGIGDPAKIKYQVAIDALPDADKQRLGAQCKPGGKTPCVVTVQGTEMGDALKVKAIKITWYN